MIDRRVLDLDMERTQVLSNDQQRLQVDAYARYRIIDPVKLVERAGTERQLESQLLPILTSVLRQELGRRPFSALINAERGTAMTNITATLDKQARNYGAQVLDVRIKAADLPEGRPLDAAFTRMQTDREEEATTIRAAGQRDAQIIQAEASAEAARIYADAYGKDENLLSLLFDDYFTKAIEASVASWRTVVAHSSLAGIPNPAFASSLSYYDGLRAERLPAALVQGQRDFFGAHTYKRVDREGVFHTLWSGDRSEIETTPSSH